MLVEQSHPRLFECAPFVSVLLVRHCDSEHPIGNRLAVDLGLERCFFARDACLVLAGQVAEEAFAGEAPQLGRRAFHPSRGLERRQVGVALVDLLDVEALLLAGEVEVELLVEIGDEAVSALAERVHVAARWTRGRHRSLGYGRRC